VGFIELLSRLSALKIVSDEDGQTLVEYALITALVSVALIAVLTLLGGTIGDVFSNIDASL
jgi:Flp pilus assembly pilin Flp